MKPFTPGFRITDLGELFSIYLHTQSFAFYFKAIYKLKLFFTGLA